jgi:zinc transporter ZupT
MFGATILLVTNNLFGAVVGVLAIGAGFAPIYPLVVERIGHRFENYHPGFYNGIVSLAFAAGLLAPATIGYFAAAWGVRVAMGLPLAGSMAVFVLVVLISIDARLQSKAPRKP